MNRAPLLAALLLTAPTVALAQQRAATAFEAADRNGDGAITREEFLASRAEQFARRDRNRDGFLDAADAGQRAATRPGVVGALGRGQQRLDANRDGKLSKDEFVSGRNLFERADSDGNGTVDATELQAMRSAVRDRVTPPLTNAPALSQ
jgi:hypothetical protein